MSPVLPPPGSRQPSANQDMRRLGEAAVRFGTEAFTQGLAITGRSWGREVNRLVEGVMRSAPPEALLKSVANSYVNWLGEMAAIAPSVAERIAMGFAQPAQDHPQAGDAEKFEIDGAPFAMPARVLDASQGSAIYFVAIEAAQRALGAASEFVTVFDAGGGRTPLTIMGVDYRNSDFGAYPEIVVALAVTAKDDPAAQVFSYCLAVVVGQEFTQRAGQAIWGLEKVLAPRLTVTYAADAVLFSLPNALSIRFPRFGDGESCDQPTFSLTQRGEGKARRNYWAMTTRSGSGEGLQIGGSVALQLGARKVGGRGADPKISRLCDILRDFDIAGKLPAANSWTERQTALLGPPRLLKLA